MRGDDLPSHFVSINHHPNNVHLPWPKEEKLFLWDLTLLRVVCLAQQSFFLKCDIWLNPRWLKRDRKQTRKGHISEGSDKQFFVCLFDFVSFLFSVEKWQNSKDSVGPRQRLERHCCSQPHGIGNRWLRATILPSQGRQGLPCTLPLAGFVKREFDSHPLTSTCRAWINCHSPLSQS